MKTGNDAEALAMLIGFDWAGKEGEARNPNLLNRTIDWATGIEGGALLVRSHDTAMVDNMGLILDVESLNHRQSNRSKLTVTRKFHVGETPKS